MKTSQVLGVLLGAVLVNGVVFAQADGAQGPGGDEGPGIRPGCRCGGGMGAAECRGARGDRDAAPMPGRGGFGHQGPRGPAQSPNPQMLKEAGATDQQIEAIKKFEDERQLKQVDLKAAVERAELTFAQLMRDEKSDEAAVLKAADTLSQARAEVFKSEIASQLKVRAILGPDVAKKMHEMRPPLGGNRMRGGCQGMDRPCMEGANGPGDQTRRPRGQSPQGECPRANQQNQ